MRALDATWASAKPAVRSLPRTSPLFRRFDQEIRVSGKRETGF